MVSLQSSATYTSRSRSSRTNLAHGPVLGQTITTDTQTGNIIVALLAVLSTLGMQTLLLSRSMLTIYSYSSLMAPHHFSNTSATCDRATRRCTFQTTAGTLTHATCTELCDGRYHQAVVGVERKGQETSPSIACSFGNRHPVHDGHRRGQCVLVSRGGHNQSGGTRQEPKLWVGASSPYVRQGHSTAYQGGL